MKFKQLALCATFAAASATIMSEPFWATDKAVAAKTLAEEKMTPSSIGSGFWGYGWMRCGFDIYATKFEATDKAGQKVTGYVCSNPFIPGSSIDRDGPDPF